MPATAATATATAAVNVPMIKFIGSINAIDDYIDLFDYVLILEKDIKKRQIDDLNKRQARDLKLHDRRIRDKFYVVRNDTKDHIPQLIAELNLWNEYREDDFSWRIEPKRSYMMGLDENTKGGLAEITRIADERIALMERLIAGTGIYVYGSIIKDYHEYLQARYGRLWFVHAKYL
jgi:hypothetical protein